MYRNCKCNKCCMNSNNNCEDNIFENMCENVSNATYSDDCDMCACGFDEEDKLFSSNPMFGQSYVPWHTMNKTFTPEVGLRMGTIFPELVSPYEPCQSMEEIAYIAATNKIGGGCNNG